MKVKMLVGICCVVCALMPMLSSCRDHGILSDDFVAGDTVTPDELADISREIFDERTETPTEPETLAPDATVYWLEGGSVYHAQADCRHIAHADADKIKSGDISEAIADGKERLCSSCTP